MRHLVTLAVDHDIPVAQLEQEIAAQAALIPGVKKAAVVLVPQRKDAQGFTDAELSLAAGEVHRS